MESSIFSIGTGPVFVRVIVHSELKNIDMKIQMDSSRKCLEIFELEVKSDINPVNPSGAYSKFRQVAEGSPAAHEGLLRLSWRARDYRGLGCL